MRTCALRKHVCGAATASSCAAPSLLQIERVRPQRTFERDPARRRMPVMKERGRAEEAFLADLALVGAGRHVGVRLARGRALDLRGTKMQALHVTALPLNTPRRIWSQLDRFEQRRKLPSPKPSLPLRWMISKKIGPMTFCVKICSSSPRPSRVAVDQDARACAARRGSRRGPARARRRPRNRCPACPGTARRCARSTSTVR